MPRDREAEKRYAQAMWFAVDQKDLRLETADVFADCPSYASDRPRKS
jgi:hypothetical protein